MKPTTPRRFKKLHEQILLSRIFSILIGLLITVIIPFIFLWSLKSLLDPIPGQKTALITTIAACILSQLGIMRFRSIYPGGRSINFILPLVLLVYSLCVIITFMLRLDVSRVFLLISGSIAVFWFHIEYVITYKYMRLKLAVIPGEKYTDEIIKLKYIDARPLTELSLNERRYDGVIAQLSHINEETQRFLTICALNRIPVYDAKKIYESFTGKVKIHRMSENNMGALLPSPVYEKTKTVIDCLLVILSLPLVIPISIISAILIKLESPGPIIYTQTRIGQGNKPFKIYKFRSMRFDRNAQEQFAGENDPRITKFGKFIRKMRIDELPQFINILKGEMSLIGPRPEQPSFVEEYNKKIPFYSYRHIVKPGISGWAQIRHGYTSNIDETQIKIEHDFYYIKNCSLSLDLIIAILTIKIMLTGFGAR